MLYFFGITLIINFLPKLIEIYKIKQSVGLTRRSYECSDYILIISLITNPIVFKNTFIT